MRSERADADLARAVRGESGAVYAAIAGAVLGAATGLVMGWSGVDLPLSGGRSLGSFAATAAGVVAAVAALTGFLLSQRRDGSEWRDLAAWRNGVVVFSVVLVHAVLAALVTYVGFLVIERGFIGVRLDTFWTAVLLATTLGLVPHWAYGSVTRLSTRRMSSLLLAFVVIGTFSAMATSPDPSWWKVHFSHLGTFRHVSSVLFNGTLIVGGILVSTFALYLSRDMRRLVADGRLSNPRGPAIVSALMVILGIALAGVGVVPVNISLFLHNFFAFGLGVVFIALLVIGPWVVRELPAAYFLASAAFLAGTVVTVVLTNTGFFGVTALEIIVFALIFGWISVFISFLGLTGPRESSVSLHPVEAAA